MRKLYEMPKTAVLINDAKDLSYFNDLLRDAGAVEGVFSKVHSYDMYVGLDDLGRGWGGKGYWERNGFDTFITMNELKRRLGMWQEGDIIINEGGDKRKVLGVCGEVIFVSNNENYNKAYSNTCTQKQWEDWGYKLLTDTPIEELTMDELCKELGREVKIKKD